MSDHFQRIVDVEATEAEAPGLAAVVVEWLVREGVVVADLTDCVLSGRGHPPGPNYARAVTEPGGYLLGLWANGMEVDTERSIFYSMGVEHILCPHCDVDLNGDADEWHRLSDDTFRTWYEGGPDTHPCRGCGRPVGLNEWRWDPPWGFGYLGFTFWNWPPLRDDFVAEVATRLGHRVVRPFGKI